MKKIKILQKKLNFCWKNKNLWKKIKIYSFKLYFHAHNLFFKKNYFFIIFDLEIIILTPKFQFFHSEIDFHPDFLKKGWKINWAAKSTLSSKRPLGFAWGLFSFVLESAFSAPTTRFRRKSSFSDQFLTLNFIDFWTTFWSIFWPLFSIKFRSFFDPKIHHFFIIKISTFSSKNLAKILQNLWKKIKIYRKNKNFTKKN